LLHLQAVKKETKKKREFPSSDTHRSAAMRYTLFLADTYWCKEASQLLDRYAQDVSLPINVHKIRCRGDHPPYIGAVPALADSQEQHIDIDDALFRKMEVLYARALQEKKNEQEKQTQVASQEAAQGLDTHFDDGSLPVETVPGMKETSPEMYTSVDNKITDADMDAMLNEREEFMRKMEEARRQRGM
jgi:hypothetical protein